MAVASPLSRDAAMIYVYSAVSVHGTLDDAYARRLDDGSETSVRLVSTESENRFCKIRGVYGGPGAHTPPCTHPLLDLCNANFPLKTRLGRSTQTACAGTRDLNSYPGSMETACNARGDFRVDPETRPRNPDLSLVALLCAPTRRGINNGSLKRLVSVFDGYRCVCRERSDLARTKPGVGFLRW